MNDLMNERTNHFYGIETKEIQIPMRDGNYLVANLYQPDSEGKFPVIMTLCPYGKDLHYTEFGTKNPTIKMGYPHLQDRGPLLGWETPNPEYWVPNGYIVIRIDERGIGRSPGKLDILSETTKRDYYDAIEWAGVQSWSNGKIGLLGISYLAMSQWGVATEQPPHLTCIVPWEGALDYYAEFCYPGGLLANGFLSFWWANGVLASQYNPDGKYNKDQLKNNRVEFPEVIKRHPLRDKFWKDRSGDINKIKVTFLSSSNWFSAGMHTRGNFLAYQYAPSKYKWLEVHLGSHTHAFYTLEGRGLQQRFLEYWLKGIDNGLLREPKVRLQIPLGGNEYYVRYENEYPLARTQWTSFYLDASTMALSKDKVKEKHTISYEGDKNRESKYWANPFMKKEFSMNEKNNKRVLFETKPFEDDTEILGPVKLKLWASSTLDDMDIFVSLRNIDPNNKEVVNSGALSDKFPVSQGSIRASLRKTDPVLSTEYKPLYTYDETQKLEPCKPYAIDIEIWDCAIVVKKGNKLVIEVGSQNQSGCAMVTQSSEDRMWNADVTIYTGEKFDSYLLLPVIPSR